MLCAWWLLDGSWQGLHDYDLIPDIELLYLFDDYHENVLVAYAMYLPYHAYVTIL